MHKQPKPVEFLGSSLNDLRGFPLSARREAGYQIDKVQYGDEPDDWKPMKTIGAGVQEIRIQDEAGAFRVIYIANQRCGLRVALLPEENTKNLCARHRAGKQTL